MTDELRASGHLGRLPVKSPETRFPIRFAHEYLAELLPVPPYPIDQTYGITGWGMLGNDRYGDCGEAGIRHIEMSTAAAASQTVPQIADQTAIDEYFAFTGGQDTGVNLADFLLWLYRKGRILGFAPVDHTNLASCDSLLALGHGLYCGVSLTDDAERLFAANQPWTTDQGQHPNPSLGHCIVKIAADGHGLEHWLTWGASQSATAAWGATCLDEVWLVLTTEEQMAAFVPALVADIEALHGTPPNQPAQSEGLFHRVEDAIEHGLSNLAHLVKEIV